MSIRFPAGCRSALAAFCGFVLLAACVEASPPELAEVRLEWRPLQSNVVLGDTVDIGLYLVSNGADPVETTGLQVIFEWDFDFLQGVEKLEACASFPCPPNTHRWGLSSFPTNGLNSTFEDGNAFYTAADLPFADVAQATVEGLLVVIFRFNAIAEGDGELRLRSSLPGVPVTTRVLAGDGSGMFADLGPPATISILSCPDPTVEVAGSRYLVVTPGATDVPVAISVEGDSADFDVACVQRYVQSDGLLGVAPVLRTPGDWGTIFVTDTEIVPYTFYTVTTHCGLSIGVDLHSDPVDVRTWRWGDVDGDGAVGFIDVSVVFDGSEGTFNGGSILQDMDVAPCVPDGEVTEDDVNLVVAAVSSGEYPCVLPCRVAPDLVYYVGFPPCMLGPTEFVTTECLAYDTITDERVDLWDFADFQVGPPGNTITGPRSFSK